MKTDLVDTADDGRLLIFECPGCRSQHGVFVDRPADLRPRWAWDGDRDSPSLDPSVVSSVDGRVVCHLWLRRGRIEYLADSTHWLAGETVALPDLTDW